MGFADSPATRNVLASHGIRVSGYRWRWAPGLKGGTYPPHRHVNGQVRTYAEDFGAEPGDDVNGDNCMCALVPAYRTPDGRMAKPGLAPIFQTPVTAAISEPFDWTPLQEALSGLTISIPDGAIVVNLPQQAAPEVIVNVPEAQPVINVEAPQVTVEAPNVTVEPPSVTVEAPTVNVEAPIVTVEPTIEIPKPATPKMLPPPKPRETRIIRDNAGTIIGMEEVT